MLLIESLLFIAAIYLGIRQGGIGIGCAGALGVFCLTFGCGMQSGTIPVDVILIILSVITASAALQAAGGMDYLVAITERVLRKKPQSINVLAPLTTYVLTLLTGTGHTAFSVMPVIVEVAQEQNIRPSRPLSMAVIASQIAVIASPLSAVVVFLAMLLEPEGVRFGQLLCISIPATFLGCIPGILVASVLGKPLEQDPVFQQRLRDGLIHVKQASTSAIAITTQAKASLFLFLATLVAIIVYALCVNAEQAILQRGDVIIVMMMSVAYLIMLYTRTSPDALIQTSVFRSGMSACVCVLGVAWMGDTFIQHHLNDVKDVARDVIQVAPWALVFVLFFAGMLLYSQAATAKALLPAIVALGASPVAVMSALPALSALFVLPTYPTLIAAVALDQTGSTRIGHAVFNHPFFIPGIVTVASSVCLSSVLAPWVLGMS